MSDKKYSIGLLDAVQEFRISMRGQWKNVRLALINQAFFQLLKMFSLAFIPLLIFAVENFAPYKTYLLVIFVFYLMFTQVLAYLPDVLMHFYARIHMSVDTEHNLIRQGLEQVVNLGYPFYSSVSPAITLHRATNLQGKVANMLNLMFWNVTNNLIILLIGLISLFIAIELKYALIISSILILEVLVFMYFTHILEQERREILKQLSDKVEERTKLFVRVCIGTPTLIRCGTLDQHLKRIEQINKEIRELEAQDEKLIINPLRGGKRDFSMYFASGLLIYVGTNMHYNNKLEVSDLIYIIALVGKIFSGVWGFSRILRDFSHYAADFRKRNQLINHPTSLPNRETVALPPGPFNIEGIVRVHHATHSLKEGTFTRSPKPSLNADLQIGQGEIIGVVGETGAGKSTIKNALSGILPMDGDATINGVPIERISMEDLQKQVIVVDQKPDAFSGSLRDNLTGFDFNSPFNDEDLFRAIDTAHFRGKVDSLEEGLDTLIGENGVNLSGGEMQRLAIARALLQLWKNPDAGLFILDEFTSALDAETEESITASLLPELEGLTIIIIAHRLSTIMNCDRVITLHQGEVVEDDTIDNLLGNGGKFARMHQIQMA